MSARAEFVRLARESAAAMLQAEQDFDQITRVYRDRFGRALGELKASSDPRRVKAQGDWLFHNRRVRAFAALAEMEAREQQPVPVTRLTAPATPADRRPSFDHHPTIHDFRRADEFYRRYAAELDRDIPGWWASRYPMAAGLAREAQLRRDAAAANEARDGVR